MLAPILPAGLDTPAIVIDLDIVERNARRLADALAARGIALRPHAKTHKSIRLAQIQLAAGARGITVGNLGEAEVFAAGGLDDLFIAYPVWAEGPKAGRLRALHDSGSHSGLVVGFDSIAGAERLAAAVAGSRRKLSVMLELDPGNRRTGTPAERAGEIAAAARSLGLEVARRLHARRSRVRPGAAESGRRGRGRDARRRRRRAPGGRHRADRSSARAPRRPSSRPPSHPVNEMRAGTYLIGDRQQWAIGAVPSRRHRDRRRRDRRQRRDRGSGRDRRRGEDPDQGRRRVPGGPRHPAGLPACRLEQVSDYHGVVRIPEGTPQPAVGEVVAVIPNHVCPVIDLRDSFIATRSGAIVGEWPVDARGRSG